MTQNIFSAITEDDDDFKITPREKFLKKAAKKLNEIERLKEKGIYHSLTIEECEKLGKEDFWKACLQEEPLKPNIKEERKRKKEEEKIKKQEAEKEQQRQYEEYKKKMDENERKRKEEEEEEEEKEKMRKAERKRKILDKKTNHDVQRLEREYKDLLLLHNGNNDKTYRLLSRKYHPDKNHHPFEWANHM